MSEQQEIVLQLGDIILIIAPSNQILNNNVFFIEYIDPNKIRLINSETFEKVTLTISDNRIADVQSIKVLSTNSESGYARQNGLLPGTWVNIYFGGEIPTVITGEITNLEEDMIEIRTTDNDVLFINFNYQGIPEDLPIISFEIRDAIRDAVKGQDEPMEDVLIDDVLIDDLGEEQQQEQGDKETAVKRMVFNMNDLDFGEAVRVEEHVSIDKDKYRYNIDTQTNDLLEEMISNIPNANRTNNVLNNIHIMITRFLQLRKISSTFDANNNINGIIKQTSEDRPLADYLSKLKNTLYWIMMVAKNVKKIYPDSNTQYDKYDDYETLDGNNSLLEMKTLFANYKSNQTTEGQNKYTQLYTSLDPYMRPFYSSVEKEDAFSKPNGVIIEGPVESTINAIIDNLGDLSSSVVSNSLIKSRKFVIQKYNLGEDKTQIVSIKNSKVITHRVKMTDNDLISVNSIVTLPEPTVRFSQVNLPGTSLLKKANLNQHFLNYWQLLKQKTPLLPVSIDGLDKEIDYDNGEFVNNIKQYFLDLTEFERPDGLTNADVFKSFVSIIVPKIRVLFKLVKKYIKDSLSLVDVVNYLEPFMIYPNDLTYMQYNEINRFIYDKIKEYNQKFKENSMIFSSLKYVKKDRMDVTTTTKDKYVYSNDLFRLTDSDLTNKVLEYYGFSDPKRMTCSPSEFLKILTLSDYSNLYNTAVSLTNIGLMFPTQLSSIFKEDKTKMAEIMSKDKKNDKCASHTVSKKYYSMDALLADNNSSIYFDKEFDTTNYSLIEEKYRTQRESLTSEQFISFLKEEFMKKGQDSNTAEELAITLVNQAKKVREGDYALLVTMFEQNGESDKMEYYVRRDDVWTLDPNIDPSLFIKDDDILCNMEYNCMYDSVSASGPNNANANNKCVSTDVSKDTIVTNALKNILEQFDKNYEISKDELDIKIHKELEYFMTTFDRLQHLKRSHFFKYNSQQYQLGLSVAEVLNTVVSPHTKLRNLIMGQNDFVKKQQDILNFVILYCREGDANIPNVHDGEMENEWWLYCKTTNTKLLPKFVYILASAFITNKNSYNDVLDDLKRKIGKRSDDGDAWVDENSGEFMCFVDMDNKDVDGFDRGDSGDGQGEGEGDGDGQGQGQGQGMNTIATANNKTKTSTSTTTSKNKRLSREGELVSNVITVLSANMGIDIEASRDFIIKVVTELMNNRAIIDSESSYQKKEEEAAKKGKKMPSYAKLYSTTLMYLILGVYLLAIQTSIPQTK